MLSWSRADTSAASYTITSINGFDTSLLLWGTGGNPYSSGGVFKNSDGSIKTGVLGPMPPDKFSYTFSIYHRKNDHYQDLWCRGESGTTYFHLSRWSAGTSNWSGTLDIEEPFYIFLELSCDDGWVNNTRTADFTYTSIW